jgi:hypothetical protein
LIVRRTEGYPYFVQEWGKHAWLAAPNSPIQLNDVVAGSILAQAELDDSFFRVASTGSLQANADTSGP